MRIADRESAPKRRSNANVGRPRRAQGEMDEPDRLLRRAAVRAGDSGDAHRDLGAGMGEGAERHRARRRFADRAVGGQNLVGNAEHLLLGFVGINDEAALEHRRRTRDFRQQGADQPAGAGFGRGELEAEIPAARFERGGAVDEKGREHRRFLSRGLAGRKTTMIPLSRKPFRVARFPRPAFSATHRAARVVATQETRH